MIFLVDYDRSGGVLLALRTYADDQASAAASDRLELELDLARRNISREVVLLQAANEADLRRTHRRYFATIAELTKASSPSRPED